MLTPRQTFKKEVRQMVISTVGLMLLVWFLTMLAVPIVRG